MNRLPQQVLTADALRIVEALQALDTTRQKEIPRIIEDLMEEADEDNL
jgi:hypothetical protein